MTLWTGLLLVVLVLLTYRHSRSAIGIDELAHMSSRALTQQQKTAVQNPCKSRNCSTSTEAITQKIVFIHVPKTGGETIESLFRILKNHYHAYYRCLMAKKQMKSAYKIGCDRPSNEFYLSIVRNPFDRMFSWFHFCIHGWYDLKKGLIHIPGPLPYSGCDVIRKRIYRDNHTFHEDHSNKTLIEGDLQYVQSVFEAYLNHTQSLARKALEPPNIIPKNEMQYAVWSTYDFYFTDPVNHTMLVDAVLRFEDIYPKGEHHGKCMGLHQSLCKAGIRVDLPHVLPHANNNQEMKTAPYIIFTKWLQFLQHKPNRLFYTQYARKLVEDYYAQDLIKYDYTY